MHIADCRFSVRLCRMPLIVRCSLNPAVDIGQVEGGLLMGLGYWLSEEILFDSKTGRLTTDGTWEYKPPSVKGQA